MDKLALKCNDYGRGMSGHAKAGLANKQEVNPSGFGLPPAAHHYAQSDNKNGQ